MEQEIVRTYLNPHLQIALMDWRGVYRLAPDVVVLIPEVYKGNLVYRAKGSNKCGSHKQIKNGLVKKRIVLKELLPDWRL
jgi:hypothetical protein